jgi:hypothetical protein
MIRIYANVRIKIRVAKAYQKNGRILSPTERQTKEKLASTSPEDWGYDPRSKARRRFSR